MIESPLVDSSFAVPVFSPRDDQISCLNKEMTFLTAVASSRFPSTNNQLRTSSNPRDQATIQDGRQCTQPQRPRNATWYKDKAMLAEAQEAGQVLDEEQLAFLIELGVQTVKIFRLSFQTMLLFRLRILILMILTVLISQMQKRFSWPTFSTMVLTLSQRKQNKYCDKCFNLEAEMLKSQNAHNDLLKRCSQLEKHCISLESSIQLNKEIFQKDESCDNQNALEIPEYFKKNVLKAQLQDKDTTIFEQAKAKHPLDNSLAFAWSSKTSDSNTPVLSPTRLKRFTSNYVSNPSCNKKNDKISQTPSRNMKNKVKVQPRNVNKKNRVVEPIRNVNVKHSPLKVNSEPICATWNRSQLINFVSKFLGTVRFGNDHITRIMGFGDYQLGNVTISRVYYVEGLGHNLCSVGQFCDADLEVAFQKNTCFIRNLEGVDLLSGSHDINLYTNYLDDMLKTSPIYLQSKASKTKSWLWHPLVITSQLWSKDEAPEAIIKCIKNIQVRLNATVRNVRTDNGTKFVNQTLCEFYENVGISHQTSVARTPQ
nr:integrase, catalytic region, zinc finger, CCHC-type, peptidase aspartic, catalytic [Tanacetum cinerariifolium]